MSKLYTCTKCGKKKQAFEFCKRSSNKSRGGLDYWCKKCYSENTKKYYEDNKDGRLRYAKDYADNNKEKIRVYQKDYRKNHQEDLKEYRKDRYINNKEDVLSKQKVYREQNKDRVAAYQKIYREDNKERIAQVKKEWNENNRDRRNSSNAKRRARKSNATPIWLTKTDLAKIRSIYKTANTLFKKSGVKYHVDHIIPLNGENVCGLHVPENLQVLPVSENLAKSNKLI